MEQMLMPEFALWTPQGFSSFVPSDAWTSWTRDSAPQHPFRVYKGRGDGHGVASRDLVLSGGSWGYERFENGVLVETRKF